MNVIYKLLILYKATTLIILIYSIDWNKKKKSLTVTVVSIAD